jgi:flagellin
VKAIKTDADINAAADGKQFKVVNDSSVFYDASLSSTSVAGGSTTAITNAKTYLVTEGSFTYGSTVYTAGKSFLGASSPTSATASGASALVEITAVSNTDETAPTDSRINNITNGEDVAITSGKSYLVTAGSLTYGSTTYTAGQSFVGSSTAMATASGATAVFSTALDFEAGSVIEKASGLYISTNAKLVTYDSPAAAAEQIVAKLQAEGITGLNLTDNIDGTFDIVLGGNLSVASATDSHKAINSIDLALQNISADRAMFGALSNRFDMSISNLSNVAANSEMSLGRLQDADFAAETSRMTTSRILEQASIAMMAQANAAKQNVLQLLG